MIPIQKTETALVRFFLISAAIWGITAFFIPFSYSLFGVLFAFYYTLKSWLQMRLIVEQKQSHGLMLILSNLFLVTLFFVGYSFRLNMIKLTVVYTFQLVLFIIIIKVKVNKA